MGGGIETNPDDENRAGMGLCKGIQVCAGGGIDMGTTVQSCTEIESWMCIQNGDGARVCEEKVSRKGIGGTSTSGGTFRPTLFR